jgi:hypothetical protein
MATNADAGQHRLTELARAVDAADGALARLSAVAELGRAVKEAERAAVADAKSGGVARSVIGARLGVSKQAAARRFGSRVGDERATAAESSKRPANRGRPGWEVTTPSGRTLLVLKRRTD